MKIIITEGKFNETIKSYIMEMFPVVYDVYFTKIRKSLGSTEGQPTIEETIINIIIDNCKNKLMLTELSLIRSEIIESIDSFFNLNYRTYGSSWDFNFQQIAVVKLNAYLENLKS